MLFFRKEADPAAIAAFWNWFSANEQWIIDNIRGNAMAVIEAVDQHLKPVFPFFRKELEFQMGYNDGVGEFFFFDLRNSNLQRGGKALGEARPENLKKNWKFIMEH